ncbi:hypothetical protein [Acinetobacter sp. NIOH-H-8]|uniref:hypothetical protein n=1 Tax=Acinetobacter sp. NIOH-H-8 TaxID=3342120 RepID=UPI003985E0A1
MDESEIIKIKGHNKYLSKLFLWGVILLIVFYIVINFWVYVGHPFDVSGEQDRRAALGALGDYFGGLLNPIFAFLSFMGVLWTLKMSREELAATRGVMDAQLKTQSLQQFDSLFFSLLSELTKKIETLVADNERYEKKYKNIYDIRTTMRIDEENEKTINSLKLELHQHNDICTIFSFLYQFLKMIEAKINQFQVLNTVEKLQLEKEYAYIVRSLIPEKLSHLLILYMYKNRNEHFRYLLEKYHFFEELDFNNKLINFTKILTASFNLPISIFGENLTYLGYRKILGINVLKNHSINNCYDVFYEILNRAGIQPQKIEDGCEIYRYTNSKKEELQFKFEFEYLDNFFSINKLLYKKESLVFHAVQTINILDNKYLALVFGSAARIIIELTELEPKVMYIKDIYWD